MTRDVKDLPRLLLRNRQREMRIHRRMAIASPVANPEQLLDAMRAFADSCEENLAYCVGEVEWLTKRLGEIECQPARIVQRTHLRRALAAASAAVEDARHDRDAVAEYMRGLNRWMGRER